MKATRRQNIIAAALVCALAFTTTITQAADDPLPSWNDGKAKQSIVDFVKRVTTPGGNDFVKERERTPRSTTTARSGPNSRCIFNSSSRSTA